MRCTIIFTLATVLAFGKSAHGYKTYYLMGEEDRMHLDPIFKEIDKLNQLNKDEPMHVPAYIIGSNGYVNESLKDSSDIIEMSNKFSRISMHYKKMRKFESAEWENDTQLSLARAQVFTGDGNIMNMEKYHLKLFGKDDFISQMAKFNQFEPQTCKTPQSPQQFLYFFYVLFYIVHELKAHALVEWSWLLLRKFGQDVSIEEEDRSAYKRTEGTLAKIKDLMSRADRSVWRCDPWEHKSGVTYEEVTRLLQGYVENEVDLNSDGVCSRDCGYYKSARNEGCFDSKFCSEQPKCSGGVHDCRFVESSMKICQAEKTSSRRYEFIEYKSGLVHGTQEHCDTWSNSAKSWNRWLFMECSYCLCLCDDQSAQSDRYFNLRPVVADVKNNRVVTGLRFVKKNRIFHLQVQEGELLPLGVINKPTLQWKPVDSYSIFDKNVTDTVDYHKLSYESRSLDLGDVKAENNSAVVTGLRFRVMGGHLQLQVQFSAVEFESGKLIDPTKTSHWTSLGTDQKREKLPLRDAQVSSKSSVPSIPYPSDNQYIEFTNTGFVQDAAQSTVPFIDIQDVVTEPAVPLSGIGIYYKGRDGYGGFLAPRLTTYDFTQYVQVPTWESMHSKDTI
ncbi:uncharacterized protein LOC6526462 [Drosophila yakuba]|uniref:Uncharacterized protein n=1 Tax=Drosophila yakuba TaxID=7245 RepID=B4P3M6_DROYA|nr:uncharacterized protein LOC6526462 [Drosophila yakuba]EDW87293.2 uncharacterized protein Dyak_GE15356 [Drosophila yakuba]